MKFLFLITLLFIVSAERLTVDVYTESLCPDCMEFIKYSLAEALATPDIDQMVHIRLIPYGNAKKTKDSKGNWVVSCQHGSVECYGNIVELCSQKRVSEKYAPLDELPQAKIVECIDHKLTRPYTNTSFDKAVRTCAPDYGVDADDIIVCAKSQEGELLHLIAGDETDNLKPAHQYVPWIVANRNHDVTAENQILDDLLGWACLNYTGEKIAACNQKSNQRSQ